MNQDMKIGLALAVLLLGIVGAFFFRNETDPTQPPPIEGTAELDKQIAEKQFVPYLTGVEVFDSERPNDSATGTKRDDSGAGSEPAAPAIGLDLPDFLREDSEESQRLAARPEPPPAPISMERSAKESPPGPSNSVARSRQPASPSEPVGRDSTPTVPFSQTPDSGASAATPPMTGVTARERLSRSDRRQPVLPRHNNAWQVVDEPDSAASAKRSERRPTAGKNQPSGSIAHRFRTHRVRKGETLSALAQRYLGDSRRFLELFEANRHLLKDPNDLRAGMVIRIPEAVSPKRPSGVQGVPAATSNRTGAARKSPTRRSTKKARPESAPRRSLKDLFEPVPHTPLNPRRRIPSAATTQQGPTSPR